MRTITPEDVAGMLRDLSQRYPDFRLVAKAGESRHCTTWQSTVFVPQDWSTYTPLKQWVRLAHEATHLQQFHDMGTWRVACRYLLASGRFQLERDAFRAEMAAACETEGPEALRGKRDFYLMTLSGGTYWYCVNAHDAALWVDTTILHICEGVSS